jgi:hypothetical protein
MVLHVDRLRPPISAADLQGCFRDRSLRLIAVMALNNKISANMVSANMAARRRMTPGSPEIERKRQIYGWEGTDRGGTGAR